MADWVTISSLATAGGTLVLAIATFSSVKSANRSARVAERSLLAGQRPILIPTHEDDPVQTVRFGDGVLIHVVGHGGTVEVQPREPLHGDRRSQRRQRAGADSWMARRGAQTRPETSRLRPTSSAGSSATSTSRPARPAIWQGAIRDRSDPDYDAVRTAMRTGARVSVDLIYGDYEGGQRTIARIGLTRDGDADGRDDDDGYRAESGGTGTSTASIHASGPRRRRSCHLEPPRVYQ